MSEDKFMSMMNETREFEPSQQFRRGAHIKSNEEYKAIYERSLSDPEGFWAEKAGDLSWFKRWDRVLNRDVKPWFKWFEGGKLNACHNCIDRHLSGPRKNKAAIIWESESGDYRTYTYQELHYEVTRFANVLKKKGVSKGDRVCIYLPMIPQLAISMLACARIGAIHSIVFGGFSSKSLSKRINDCEAKILVTSDGSYHGGKIVPLKAAADEALRECPSVTNVIVVKRVNNNAAMQDGRDTYWFDEMNAPDLAPRCDCEEMDAEDSLFILYTSGTTGTPKGILHTTGGYMTYSYHTFRWIFDYKDEDVYWCTADIGWITGHSYIIYGPLSNGATSIMFEGIPTYPQPDRFWQIIEKYRVSVFYTAPTVLRSLLKLGTEWPDRHDMTSLRLLGSVGEPINPEAWLWYFNVIGKGRCPIVDTWWQTETGGIMITPLPGATTLKPGSATFPFPGIDAAIFREDGTVADPNEGGYLVIRKPWPGLGRTVWNNPDRYKKTYFGRFGEDIYLAGDTAKRDEGGYFWIMGRSDDVLKISGHKIGTAEVESALVSHHAVAEAAVVGVPHALKGQALYAFVTLKQGIQPSDALIDQLRKHVAAEIGPIAKPDLIQFSDGLPKTRSGKIMRRILKAIAEGQDKEGIGDTTTLADPNVVDRLMEQRVR